MLTKTKIIVLFRKFVTFCRGI